MKVPSSQGGLDKEAKVGAMLRHMSGDVSAAFEKTLKDLYRNEKGEIDDLGESCAKWHWVVVKYASEPMQMRNYVSTIQYAFDNGINLDAIPSWKKLMRIILPEEFLKKMGGFTQVPQIAVMDETKLLRVESRDSSEVDW